MIFLTLFITGLLGIFLTYVAPATPQFFVGLGATILVFGGLVYAAVVPGIMLKNDVCETKWGMLGLAMPIGLVIAIIGMIMDLVQ